MANRKSRLPPGLVPLLLSPAEAAEHCGVPIGEFVAKLRPKLRPITIGALVRYDRRRLDEVLGRPQAPQFSSYNEEADPLFVRARQLSEIRQRSEIAKIAARLARQEQARWTNLLRSAKKNAVVRDIPWDLSSEEFSRLVDAANGQCAITGIQFDWSAAPGFRRPFAPSLDRIVNSLGYKKGNVRLVCCVVNFALGEWGEAVFWRMVEAAHAKRHG